MRIHACETRPAAWSLGCTSWPTQPEVGAPLAVAMPKLAAAARLACDEAVWPEKMMFELDGVIDCQSKKRQTTKVPCGQVALKSRVKTPEV
jgi:hypothetical protein